MNESDWVGDLGEEDRRIWNEFVAHWRRTSLAGLVSSNCMISLMEHGEFDTRLALELGAAILLDKPLIAVLYPGVEVNKRLKRAADVIVHADLDTEEGRKTLQLALAQFMEEECVDQNPPKDRTEDSS